MSLYGDCCFTWGRGARVGGVRLALDLGILETERCVVFGNDGLPYRIILCNIPTELFPNTALSAKMVWDCENPTLVAQPHFHYIYHHIDPVFELLSFYRYL